MKFRTMIEGTGKTTTGIIVPPEVVAELGQTKRPAVRVTVGGHTYRSTVASMSGTFMISLSAENRAKAGVAAGDEVDVELVLDTAPRAVAVPSDLAKALKGDPEAKRFFESLSYSNQSWYVIWIEGAKKADTRERRVAKAVTMLREGKPHG
jgi:hypothetical protein